MDAMIVYDFSTVDYNKNKKTTKTFKVQNMQRQRIQNNKKQQHENGSKGNENETLFVPKTE